MTATYRDCERCEGELVFDLDDSQSEGPDYSVGLMGYTFVFVLNLEDSCEHAGELTPAEREALELRVGYEYAESYTGPGEP